MINFLNFPFLKRLVPSLIRRARVFFNKNIFWTEIDGIYYLINIQEKLDREFYFKKKYEENNFKFIFKNKFFEKPFIFIDIGSNIGIYSLIISLRILISSCIVEIFRFSSRIVLLVDLL